MNCYYTKAKLYQTANSIRTNVLHSDLQNYPLDLVTLFENSEDLDFAKLPFQTHSLRGMAIKAENARQNDIILLNSHLSPVEQNFYCAHELIHLCLHRDLKGNTFHCYEKVRPNQNPFIEWHANEGAAELLVPYTLILPLIAESRIFSSRHALLDIYDLKAELAKRFLVTEAVINYRLEGLKYEIFQYLSGTPLEEIEILSNNQQKKQDIYISSLNELAYDNWQGMPDESWEGEKDIPFEKAGQDKQDELDSYNMMMTERLRDRWLDVDYDYHG